MATAILRNDIAKENCYYCYCYSINQQYRVYYYDDDDDFLALLLCKYRFDVSFGYIDYW